MTSLSSLMAEISVCRHCEDEGLIPEARPIFQLPDDPVIGVIGQAPGNLAHQERLPFRDPSGVRLRAWMGITEDEFYHGGRLAIIPMAFCFPGYDGSGKTGKGGDLPPPKVCAQKWQQKVTERVIPKLKIILLVGVYSQRWHLGTKMKKSVTETVADWSARFEEAEGGGPVWLPLPHPSWRNSGWLKKNPWFENEHLPKLQQMIKEIW